MAMSVGPVTCRLISLPIACRPQLHDIPTHHAEPLAQCQHAHQQPSPQAHHWPAIQQTRTKGACVQRAVTSSQDHTCFQELSHASHILIDLGPVLCNLCCVFAHVQPQFQACRERTAAPASDQLTVIILKSTRAISNGTKLL